MLPVLLDTLGHANPSGIRKLHHLSGRNGPLCAKVLPVRQVRDAGLRALPAGADAARTARTRGVQSRARELSLRRVLESVLVECRHEAPYPISRSRSPGVSMSGLWRHRDCAEWPLAARRKRELPRDHLSWLGKHWEDAALSARGA